jgi:hypothetical protein
LLLTAKTSRSQPPKPPTQRALADPPAGARFIAQPCCLESSASKFCSSPLAAYWRSASPISSNLRPAVACRARAGGHGADRPFRVREIRSGEKEGRAFVPVLKACIGDEIWWPRPSGAGGLGVDRGRATWHLEVTHLPACLLGKQTRLRVFLSATGDARRMGRFHR